ncbi:hypothetical protein KSD_03920 [Ktedonobacter sp. SOSP1-85]|uniref:pentapeptide repeat-containing protein n=1 Tax=Ktedonobacter sp. SOSP1-85 TaxID=2778367 RepID=UPI001916451C|nr:pentapeptide repeat-containing protein [Ktedonobacter sp. SOSP1-85]GHO72621.1 hypothetical protein KSD_03920 [Ktedonobacter sp. SOSP1-85]
MQQKQHLWERRSFMITLCASVLGLGLVAYLLFLGYQVTWTGFSVPVCPTNQQCPSLKTLWDWLQLLIVPLALTGAGLWFSQVQKKTEVAISKDKQREDLLQAYLDRMSELLLREDLRHSKPNSEARNVARVRTLTILRQLDTPRINHVLSFLRDAKLVTSRQGESIVSLCKADMQGLDLQGMNAYNIDLSGANLSHTNLDGANFSGANLSNAKLDRATLVKARLNETDFSGATFVYANLSKAIFYRTCLSKAHLGYADLRGARFYTPDLCKAYFGDAKLDGVNLSKLDLSEAEFTGASLVGTNLSKANLSDTCFEVADLRGANLEEANLEKADLKGANLKGANLKGACIQHALNYTERQQEKEKTLEPPLQQAL